MATGLCRIVMMVGLVGIATATGQFVSSRSGEAKAADSGKNDAPLRGLVRAKRQATLSTEQILLVVEAPLRDGDRFKRGDVLIAFDCRRQRADHGAAVAAFREATLNLQSSTHLDRFKAVGRNELEIARARADRSKHEQDGLAARLDECQVVAPFDGRVVDIAVRRFERTQPQRAYLSIIDDTELEIEAIVPSHLLSELKVGAMFSFRVDELAGKAVSVSVAGIGAAVDPVSKTIKIIGTPLEQLPGILAGMSGTAQFWVGQ